MGDKRDLHVLECPKCGGRIEGFDFERGRGECPYCGMVIFREPVAAPEPTPAPAPEQDDDDVKVTETVTTTPFGASVTRTYTTNAPKAQKGFWIMFCAIWVFVLGFIAIVAFFIFRSMAMFGNF
ncbi:MAG: hypothetical protein IJJ14_02850 [Coriobacteriales bacterium]|nr:hypothetical protein [Coriobacteriales bacterium]MBQ6585763.1 hypothetical protein [Coriobacteriales bacterium]